MNGGDGVEQREISLARFWETAGARDYKAHEAERQAIETALNDFMAGGRSARMALSFPQWSAWRSVMTCVCGSWRAARA